MQDLNTKSGKFSVFKLKLKCGTMPLRPKKGSFLFFLTMQIVHWLKQLSLEVYIIANWNNNRKVLYRLKNLTYLRKSMHSCIYITILVPRVYTHTHTRGHYSYNMPWIRGLYSFKYKIVLGDAYILVRLDSSLSYSSLFVNSIQMSLTQVYKFKFQSKSFI